MGRMNYKNGCLKEKLDFMVNIKARGIEIGVDSFIGIIKRFLRAWHLESTFYIAILRCFKRYY